MRDDSDLIGCNRKYEHNELYELQVVPLILRTYSVHLHMTN